MPFTFAHPAIILPLSGERVKKWFSLTGLVIGSMAPDFEYFMRMKPYSEYSHTIGGIFWFDLPLCILLAFIFHNLIRNCLYSNLPLCLQSRLNIYKDFDWSSYFRGNWIIVIYSMLIGISTHILWDSFSHETGYFVQKISLLEKNINISGISVSVYKIVQHGSTLLGVLIIIFTIYKLPQQYEKTTTINKTYWIILFSVFSLIIVIRLATGLNYRLYGVFITTVISAFLISLILAPLLMRIRTKT